MYKTYAWVETATGHVMTVNGVNRWLIRESDGRFKVYEVVKHPSDCLLRDVRFSLNSAKHRAYLIECNEHNSRYRMTLAQ